MFIYALKRKDVTLALISRFFAITPYYLMIPDISPIELEMIQSVAEDLCIDNVDFKEYSKYWINDYTLKIYREF